ncbi:MAG: transglycosylase SLT domain-containing protein [Candidatus Marinimicrobia bacterium]|nr:transglycosylase SLT domain-containing protein [Candidatus Neomarinimicrobiota bacterium]
MKINLIKPIKIPPWIWKWAYFIGVGLFFLFLFCYLAFGMARVCSAYGEGYEITESFLGIYKKTMRFYPQIEKYSKKYGVDINLSLAIAMYESGGNENLTSHAGAKGLMQVMPSTKKWLKFMGGVRTPT